ncbi:hypothetical protein HanXRQr2_Chr09g0366731 [Helianthus annuus]|uniref:Uncharacterized protein n=1 Tax=Helianthus annuus TaxID=4232 RepID=A0A9K3I3G9_HELAN|nr:hypothetical protein HanXRQr2_Chr09g0366731 [Helianthus annuus]KAJ0524573.1 hypothetical protein HanHA300_Chr09g0302001 [Helianthus annuus]KAJ0532287.1 hypothetical protein HanIR_Chr09g0395031 [Helianthus annuus]KAJ0540838.1 hypothetical protein HanHA89_Chr09g0321361 [Helianthus annuus]KAJ0710054.1 hypothetical protein HanOQP8_Chr09g0307731 [Helianthus annuus]
MADTTEDEDKISIKVIVDKVNKRVVCAEVDYSFVDILFSYVTLPMGTIARLLGTHDDKKFECLGSFNNLYHSLKDLPHRYLSTECKSMLLNPRSLSYDYCRHLELKIDDTEPSHYFECHNRCCSSYDKVLSCNNLSSEHDRSQSCRGCYTYLPSMRFEESYWYSSDYDLVSLFTNSVGSGVFVSDSGTFIVTDDLCVEPYNMASSIRLLTDLGITDMNHLEERNLQMSSYQVNIDCKLFTYTLTRYTIQVRSVNKSNNSLIIVLFLCTNFMAMDSRFGLFKSHIYIPKKQKRKKCMCGLV